MTTSNVPFEPRYQEQTASDRDREALIAALDKAIKEIGEFYEQQYPGGKPRERSFWEKMFPYTYRRFHKK